MLDPLICLFERWLWWLHKSQLQLMTVPTVKMQLQCKSLLPNTGLASHLTSKEEWELIERYTKIFLSKLDKAFVSLSECRWEGPSQKVQQRHYFRGSHWNSHRKILFSKITHQSITSIELDQSRIRTRCETWKV